MRRSAQDARNTATTARAATTAWIVPVVVLDRIHDGQHRLLLDIAALAAPATPAASTAPAGAACTWKLLVPTDPAACGAAVAFTPVVGVKTCAFGPKVCAMFADFAATPSNTAPMYSSLKAACIAAGLKIGSACYDASDGAAKCAWPVEYGGGGV